MMERVTITTPVATYHCASYWSGVRYLHAVGIKGSRLKIRKNAVISVSRVK